MGKPTKIEPPLWNHEREQLPVLLINLHLVVAAGPVDGQEDLGLRWDSLEKVEGCLLRPAGTFENLVFAYKLATKRTFSAMTPSARRFFISSSAADAQLQQED